MEPTFTMATLFWLFIPMLLLIVFSLISLFNQIQREKKQKNSQSHLDQNTIDKNITAEKRGS